MHSYVKIKQLVEETPLLHAEIKEIEESLRARFTAA
jgi:hypothetical protein